MKLIIEDDEGQKTVVPIVREEIEITIGRQEGNTIRLTERNISRRHAKLLRKNGTVFIEDTGSYNGIKVNGDKIAGRLEVNEGDLIQIGDYDLAIQTDVPKTEASPVPSGDTTPVPTSSSSSADETAARPGTAPSAAASVPRKAEPTALINAREALQGALEAQNRPVTDIAVEEAPRLLLLTTDAAGREYACIRTEIRIGRDDDNDIAIDHRSISRNHCKVQCGENGEWRVTDLESANGIKVNGETYATSILRRGDTLELGHLKFRFLAPGEEYVPDEAPPFGSPSAEKTSVEAPKAKLPVPLIAFGLAVLVAAAVGAYLMLGRGSKPAPSPTDLPAPAFPGELPPQKAAPTEPAVDVPPPVDLPIDPKVQKALEAGRDLLAKGKYGEAEKKLQQAKEGGAPGAEALLAQARSELESQRYLAAAQKKLGNKDYAGARTELDAIPPDSAFGSKARTLLDQIAAVEAKQARERESSDERLRAEEERRQEAKAKSDAAKVSAEEERQRKAEEARAKAEAAKAKADEEKQRKADDARAKAEAEKQKKVEAASDGDDVANGIQLFKQKKFKEASALFERAIKNDPSAGEVHMYLGSCYARMGDFKKGAVHYELFVKLRPDHPQAVPIRDILRQYYEKSGGGEGK